MIQEIKTEKGFSVIKINAKMSAYLGDLICDYCNSPLVNDDMYYISVLNQLFCKECYNKWYSDANYYIEDAPIEDWNHRKMRYHLELIEKYINDKINCQEQEHSNLGYQ